MMHIILIGFRRHFFLCGGRRHFFYAPPPSHSRFFMCLFKNLYVKRQQDSRNNTSGYKVFKFTTIKLSLRGFSLDYPIGM